jgi:hypothetical protein
MLPDVNFSFGADGSLTQQPPNYKGCNTMAKKINLLNDKEGLFKRIPKSLFSDPIWLYKKFTRKEAYLDLFVLVFDADEDAFATVEARGYFINIYPGEVARGYRYLADRWGWSTKTVGRFISNLEEVNHIKIRTKKPLTVFKLNQYVPRLSIKGNAKETQKVPGGGQLHNKHN